MIQDTGYPLATISDIRT